MRKMKKFVLTVLTVLMLVLTLAVSGCNVESSMSDKKSSKTSSIVTTDPDSDSGETPSTSESDSKEDEKPNTSEGDSKSDESSNTSESDSKGDETPTPSPDYGELTIANVEVGYGKTAEITPVFTKDSEDITYEYDISKISIEDNVVTGLVAEAVVEVTATTEHLSTTFTVTVGKNYKFTIADITVDYNSTATISPVFEVTANAENVTYDFSGNDISITESVVKGLVQNTTVTVTASTDNYSTTFTVTVGKDYTFTVNDASVKFNYSVTITPVFTVTANAEEVTYTCTEEGVTIEGNVITGTKANAVVTVMATSAHYTTTFTVTVGQDYGKLTINNVEVKYGSTATIVPNFTTVTEDITYTYDTSKITIESGVITPLVHEATVQVTATTTHHEVTFTVTVSTDWGTLTIDDATVKYGKTTTITPNFTTYADDITYSYNVADKISISSDGVITVISNEDIVITVTATTAHDVSATFTVTVSADWGTFSVENVTVDYKGTATVVYTFTTLTEEISYEFSGSDISIENGVVTGLTAGAVVTVTAKTAHHDDVTFTVTVGAKKQVTLTITYTGANSNPETYTATLLEEDTYSVNAPVVKGYTPNTTVVSGVMDKQDVNVTVTYTANVFNLTYNLLGGTAGASTPASASYDSLFTIPSPTRDGYKFSGWQVSGADYTIATYGSSASQLAILNELVYCYQKETDNYWDGDVTFKNLTSEAGATITLTATWTSLTQLSGAKDSAGVINSGNVGLSDSAKLEIANGLTGTFELTFSYYQNAVIDETDLGYSNAKFRTGLIGIGKYTDHDLFTYIRQDGYFWNGTSGVGTVTSSDEDYNADNDYGGMFYGLTGNDYASDSTKFANFVKNAIVVYTVKGYNVGQRGGYLEITQNIISYSNDYKSKQAKIVYDVKLTDGEYFNKGLDFVIFAEDAELSVLTLQYTSIGDNTEFSYVNVGTVENPTSHWDLLSSNSHYAPDKYWEGDFDFTVSYEYAQIGDFADWDDICYRNAQFIVYDWDNKWNAVSLRNDWWADWFRFGNFIFDNTYNNDVGEFDTYPSTNDTDGKLYGGTASSKAPETVALALFKEASVTTRIMRSGNVVSVYMFVCEKGTTEAKIVNCYTFSVEADQKISFQIVGVNSTLKITTGDTAPVITLAGDVLDAGTHGFTGYGAKSENKKVGHLAFPFPVEQGSKVKFDWTAASGTGLTLNWATKEFSAYYGAWDGKHTVLVDTNWSNSTEAGKEWKGSDDKTYYTISQDCYISIGLQNFTGGSATAYSSVDQAYSAIKACFTFEIKLSDTITTQYPKTVVTPEDPA